jgi:filamentous hemagglutinin family protein
MGVVSSNNVHIRMTSALAHPVVVMRCLAGTLLLYVAVLSWLTPTAIAQITSDTTLPENSRVAPGCTSCTINGGTIRGNNLFHSFREFSVPTGGEAYFNNALSIQNIFSRVTGSNPSTIDGAIRANGTANFYFLNPNGILFGPNARLIVGGSFLATTANRLLFVDGSEFSTTPSPSSPLLTNSVPIGLGFLNPGPIQVQGTGHSQFIFSVGDAFTSSLLLTGQGQSPNGLRVQPEKTLALVGGSVDLQSGVVTAPSGRIEIGSVQKGIVFLLPNAAGFSVEYTNATSGPVTLAKQAALDATGDRFSNIHVSGQTITVTDASLMTISNTGTGTVGAIQLNAQERVSLIGLTEFNRQELLPPIQKIKRTLVSDTISGQGANISIKAPEVKLDQSAYVSTLTFGSGRSGNVQITADRLIDIRRIAPKEFAAIGSGVNTSTYGSSESGTIEISTRQLQVDESGSINTVAYSTGTAGNVFINATDLILVKGGNSKLAVQTTPTPSAILTFGPTFVGSQSTSTAPTGNVYLTTRQLQVLDGAQLATIALGFGKAGTLTLNALDSLEVRGVARLDEAELQRRLTPEFRKLLSALNILDKPIPIDQSSPSRIGSGAGLANAFTSAVLSTPSVSISEAGSTIIRTRQLTLADNAQITVQNTGIGDAGVISIQADHVRLTRGGEIAASTFNGNGGNIEIISDLIFLNRGSINASAAGETGNGGNVAIFSDVLAAVRSPNRITANSVNAFGGRVLIQARGVFLSPGTIVSATSNRGLEFSGIIDIQTPETDLSRSSIQVVPAQNIPEVAITCGGGSGTNANSFTVSGTGGIPINPDEFLGSQGGWRDPEQPQSQSSTKLAGSPPPIMEAQGWERTSANSVRFTVTPGTSSSYHSDALTGCIKR